MGDFLSVLGDLFEMMRAIWKVDDNVRDKHHMGGSQSDKEPQRPVRWVCGMAIIMAIIAGLTWVLISR